VSGPLRGRDAWTGCVDWMRRRDAWTGCVDGMRGRDACTGCVDGMRGRDAWTGCFVRLLKKGDGSRVVSPGGSLLIRNNGEKDAMWRQSLTHLCKTQCAGSIPVLIWMDGFMD